MEISTFANAGSIYKKLGRYRLWSLIFVAFLSFIVGLVIFQQKLQNDQVEFTQPDGSFVFEGDLASLPLFGQTFVPRQAGLRGIYIPISVQSNGGTGALNLHLRTDPEATEDIRTVTFSLTELEGPNLARFSFDPLPDSFNTRYYFFIEPVPGEGGVKLVLYYGGPTVYVDGALYLHGEPQDSQAKFYLAYDRLLILLDWGNWFIKSGMNLLAMILLTLLPGMALLIWLWPKHFSTLFNEIDHPNHIEWIALASGLSIAVYPILLLWGKIAGIRFGPSAIIIILTVSGLSLASKFYLHHKDKLAWTGINLNYIRSNLLRLGQSFFSPPILLFWTIFILAAGVRIFVIRGQDMPMWQDSYHHSMISQLLVDNGGLFDAWTPYASIESFTYHFGFHTFVAAYYWLTGSDIFQAVLATGQLMNLLAVLVVFALGRRLGGSDWAGAFAALITGLISEYPMFYVNWGRYTQLTGQVILPVLMILTWLILKTPKPNYKLLGLTSLSVAGLALTHYRVLLFYFCFVISLLLLSWLRAKGERRQFWKDGLRLLVIGVGSFLIVSPWLWRVVGGRLWQVNINFATGRSNDKFISELINANPNLFDYVFPLVVILGLIGMIWGNWQKQEGIFLTSSWIIMLFILANPHLLNLPGVGVITYFAVLIMAYLPFSILAGFILAQIAQAFISSYYVLSWVTVLLALGAGFIGAQERILSFEPQNAMVTKPDLVAMEWIRENTSPESTFWINARVAYTSLVVGTDAGWWIPFLTGRHTPVLPMLAGIEVTTPFDYTAQTHALYQQLSSDASNLSAMWQTQRKAGITHIYIGQRRGEVWRGVEQPLNPIVLENSPYYQPVYHQDQVWIFALCEQTDPTNCKK